jgi:hypothetical protein
MKQLRSFKADQPSGLDHSSQMVGFTQYVESQACRMEQCGWAEEAKNLRGWAKELRSSSVDAEFMIQEPLLPRS